MDQVRMQELQNRVAEGIQEYFDSYDWGGKFLQQFGDLEKEN